MKEGEYVVVIQHNPRYLGLTTFGKPKSILTEKQTNRYVTNFSPVPGVDGILLYGNTYEEIATEICETWGIKRKNLTINPSSKKNKKDQRLIDRLN